MGLEEILVEAAKRLGLAADRIWPQLVVITYYRSLFWLILDPVIVLGGIVTILRAMPRLQIAVKCASDEEVPVAIACMFAIGIAALSIVVVFASVGNHVAGVVAPEAQMIREFLDNTRR